MNDEEGLALETRIQELLAGRVAQSEIAELLTRIAQDDDARRILGEMVEFQQEARNALAYGVGDEVMRVGTAKAVKAAQQEETGSNDE